MTGPISQPFVGRQRELALIEAVLKESLNGLSRIILLAGEAGIGKSRISVELRRIAQDRGARGVLGIVRGVTGWQVDQQ